MNEVNYSDAMVAELEAIKSLDWDGAKALGLKLGRSAASIVAKFKSLGGTYTAKERKAVVGVINKRVYIKEIEKKLGFVLVSLDKMTKVDLIKLNDALVVEEVE